MKKVIELTDITKTYTRGKVPVPVLKGVNLSIEEGEYMAIMGRSGSGKSTLMNIMGLLDKPTEGTYLLDGTPAAGLPDRKRSELRNRHIGFVFQSFNLFPHLSGMANIETPMMYAGISAHERRKRAETLLERVGLGHRGHHRPTELSGGECQRLAIARALTNKPSLILADEPTGNLDESTGEKILGLFRELNAEGTTIVMITHNPEMEQHVDRTVFLLDGQTTDICPWKSEMTGASPKEPPAPPKPPSGVFLKP